MKTSDSIIVHPDNDDKFEALKMVLKAMKIKFEITKDEPTKQEVISNLKKGFEEMTLIKKGKLKTTSLKHFLNEL